MQVAALLILVRYLDEASGDTGLLKRPCEAVASIEASVTPVWRHRLEAQRAAFEHGLKPVDAAIALSQALRPAKAVGRAVAHAELFEAEPAAWCVAGQPQLFSPSTTFRADEIGPRAAVREFCMSDADEFVLLAERYDGLPVLKSDSARGLEARYAEANKFVKEDAAIRVDSAFWHELKATVPCATTVRYHHTTGNRCDHLRPRQSYADGDRVLDGNAVKSGRISGCGSSASLLCGGRSPHPPTHRTGSKPIRKPLI